MLYKYPMAVTFGSVHLYDLSHFHSFSLLLSSDIFMIVNSPGFSAFLMTFTVGNLRPTQLEETQHRADPTPPPENQIGQWPNSTPTAWIHPPLPVGLTFSFS